MKTSKLVIAGTPIYQTKNTYPIKWMKSAETPFVYYLISGQTFLLSAPIRVAWRAYKTNNVMS